MSERLIENINYLIKTYGEHIKNEKQLVLLYWQKIDGVEMDKTSISTPDFLNKATDMSIILDTYRLIKIGGLL